MLSLKIFFREINSLVICSEKPLLSRNFCQCVRVNFRDFPLEFLSWNQFIISSNTIYFDGNFCKNIVVRDNFLSSQIQTVVERKIGNYWIFLAPLLNKIQQFPDYGVNRNIKYTKSQILPWTYFERPRSGWRNYNCNSSGFQSLFQALE